MKAIFPIPTTAYKSALRRAVRDALDEDLGSGDLTTKALRLKGRHGQAILLAKENGVLAGADAFTACFNALDSQLALRWKTRDGGKIRKGQHVAAISGDAAAILSAERCALNFIAHLSGIATRTAAMVDLIGGRRTLLLDTRKTTPGLRILEKRATRLGGATNHRLGLYDALMLKDNHIAAVGTIEKAIPLAMKSRGRRQLICEVKSQREICLALGGGATWLLLDNFEPRQLAQAVQQIRRWQSENRRRITIEVSGGVTPKTVGRIARLGVDYISSGWITHSATALNFSLEWTGPPASVGRVRR